MTGRDFSLIIFFILAFFAVAGVLFVVFILPSYAGAKSVGIGNLPTAYKDLHSTDGYFAQITIASTTGITTEENQNLSTGLLVYVQNPNASAVNFTFNTYAVYYSSTTHAVVGSGGGECGTVSVSAGYTGYIEDKTCTTLAPGNDLVDFSIRGHVTTSGAHLYLYGFTSDTWPTGYCEYTCGTLVDYWFQQQGYWTGLDLTDTLYTTRITSVVPADKSSPATSTSFSFGVSGYIASSDFVPGSTYVDISASNNTDLALIQEPLAFQDSFSQHIRWYATTSGYFSFSTTTSLTLMGGYTMTTEIRSANFLWPDTLLVSTSTEFTAGTSTTLDVLQQLQNNVANQFFEGTTTLYCDAWTDFANHLGTCLFYLVVPPPQEVAQLTTEAKNGFLSKAPFSWGLEVYTTFTDNTVATATLPSLSVPLPNIGYGTDTLAMAPFSDLGSSTSSPVYGILNYIEPYWETFWGFLFIFWLIEKILGAPHKPEHKGATP